MALIHVDDALIWELIDRDTATYKEEAVDAVRADQVWAAVHRHSAVSVHRSATVHIYNAKFHLYSGILVGHAWLRQHDCLRPAWIAAKNGPDYGPHSANDFVRNACVHAIKPLAGPKRKQVWTCYR